METKILFTTFRSSIVNVCTATTVWDLLRVERAQKVGHQNITFSVLCNNFWTQGDTKTMLRSNQTDDTFTFIFDSVFVVFILVSVYCVNTILFRTARSIAMLFVSFFFLFFVQSFFLFVRFFYDLLESTIKTHSNKFHVQKEF